MMESIQQFVLTTDPIWQWLAVAVISTIPYVESYFGSTIGIISGVPPFIAIVAAIIGNWLSMLAFVSFGQKLRQWRKVEEKHEAPKRQKLKRAYEKYGVPGVSLVGQTILPSQVTSMAMVTFGASKARVIFWQTISIILWGVALGIFAVVSRNALY